MHRHMPRYNIKKNIDRNDWVKFVNQYFKCTFIPSYGNCTILWSIFSVYTDNSNAYICTKSLTFFKYIDIKFAINRKNICLWYSKSSAPPWLSSTANRRSRGVALSRSILSSKLRTPSDYTASLLDLCILFSIFEF